MVENETELFELVQNFPDPNEFLKQLKFQGELSIENADKFLDYGITLIENTLLFHGIGLLENALSIYLTNKETIGQSKCYANLSGAYVYLSNFSKAIEYGEKGLSIAEENKDEDAKASCLLALSAAYYHSLGDISKAIEYTEKALSIATEKADLDLKAKTYGNLGVLYFNIGNFSQAIKFHEDAINIAKELYPDIVLRSSAMLGLLYVNLSNFSKAIEYAEMALSIAEENKFKFFKGFVLIVLGIIYLTIAHQKSEKPFKAIEFLEKALSETEYEDAKTRCHILLSIANLRSKNMSKAIENLKTAIMLIDKTKDLDAKAKYMINISVAYQLLGDNSQAIEYAEKALSISKDINNIPLETAATIRLSDIFFKLNSPQLAYHFSKRTIDLIETLGGNVLEEENKIGLLNDTFGIYDNIIQSCLELKKEKEAYEYVEKSKSRAFLDVLATGQIRYEINNPSKELSLLLEEEKKHLEKLQQIKTNQLILNNPINEIDPSYHNKEEVTRIDDLIREHKEIYDKIAKIDPKYASIRSGKPLTLDEIQHILLEKGNIVIVEYFTLLDKVLIFVISSDFFIVKEVSLSLELLTNYITEYFDQIFDHDVSQHPKSDGKSQDLGKYLLEPISEYLNDGSTYDTKNSKMIYFVPHGILHYFPLHTLDIDGRPLIMKKNVAYLPSASLLQFYNNKGSTSLKSCVAFGVDFPWEAEEVADIFNTQPCIDATKNTVYDNIYNKDILHFSCHGVFDYDDPLSSGILLYNEKYPKIRDVLTAREIFNLKINAELVTLSACETGINETKPGDELIGLTRSFLYAGVASVVVSLWSVEASSTRKLMHEFYEQLKDGKDKATALQQAQIKIMKTKGYEHPYYWGAFVLIGNCE